MASGIPALLNNVAAVTNAAALLVADAQIIQNMFQGPKWGIGVGGFFQIVPDSIIDLDFKRDWQVPNYPQEEGAFESYNKVAMPYDARVRMTKGGTDADRAAFLNRIDALAASLTLFDVVMPELVYKNSNIVHYDYRRTATSGVSLLTVDLWLLEIRVSGNAAFSNTAAPSGANPVNTGTVQPQTPTAAQAAAGSAPT